MRIVFISCYFNHHQKPVCDVLNQITKGEFRFVATEKISEWRKQLGYNEITASYVINYSVDCNKEEILNLINQADVVVTDAEDLSLTSQRYHEGKLTFRFCERLFKSRTRYLKAPLHFLKALWTRKMFLLCNSAYTASDFRKLGFYKDHAYKWGYFPETKHYDSLDSMINTSRTASILWAGRLIEWKHPEYAIYAAQYLRMHSVPFTMSIIGTGELFDKLQSLIVVNNLEGLVRMLGPMSPERVREYMEFSDVFLFTSDRNEGWGAVLNEAMNSACAVVANYAIGSVPYLIRNGENGFYYRTQNEFLSELDKVVKDINLRHRLQKSAYETIINQWNANVAAHSFVRLVNGIRNGDVTINDGPCSMA